MSVLQAADDHLSSIINRISAVIGSNNFPTGDRAALRRMTPDQPLPLIFYRFALRYLPSHWDHTPEETRNWSTIVTSIAIMSPNAHNPTQGLGRALGQTGFSEARLERLLQSSGDTRRTLLVRAARFLAAKGTACNWVEGARLLLIPESNIGAREHIHHRIAKDFYYSQQEAER